jgi:hypothetical protein
MRQSLLRAGLLLPSWAIGLLAAAATVPGVSLSIPGFIVAVAIFAVTQAVVSSRLLHMPHRHASLLLGGTGLVLTVAGLILASFLTRGITIDGIGSWLATMVLVWLVTTIGAITLPELLIRDRPARRDAVHAPVVARSAKFRQSPDNGGRGDGRHA